MSDRVLVAYATRYGSTREVAEAVGASLREAGLQVDLKRLRDAKALQNYRAVVIGAPLYMFRWHKDAHHFLIRHREALPRLQVGAFALGPFHDEEKEWTEARSQLDKALATYPWFLPTDVAVFGGKYDPQKLGLPWSLLPALKKLPPTDIRDWDAIREWAQELARTFEPEEELG